jgi:hypothetical protein
VHPVLADLQPLARLLGLPTAHHRNVSPGGRRGLCACLQVVILVRPPIDVCVFGPRRRATPPVSRAREEIRAWIQAEVNARPRRKTYSAIGGIGSSDALVVCPGAKSTDRGSRSPHVRLWRCSKPSEGGQTGPTVSSVSSSRATATGW